MRESGWYRGQTFLLGTFFYLEKREHMKEITSVKEAGLAAIAQCTNLGQLTLVRNEYLSKKGLVANLMNGMKDLDPSLRPAFGALINNCKEELELALKQKQEVLQDAALVEKMAKEWIDISLPATGFPVANLHPLTLVQQEIEDIFRVMGYQVVEGPEVELDLYNFERANIPADHPARDMQDTFYVDSQWLLRTHTTAIQTRTLESSADDLPIKVVCPGKVYRRDDDDATHSHQFTQIEGLVVGKDITLADLKGTLQLLAKSMFGDGRVIRFRPSYFQFTEPSVEVDVSCHICNGKGCNVCKGSGWIEILGAGMVHPHVLDMAGIDGATYTGFAFGLGVERVAMLKYGIDDIRHCYINDARFLRLFKRFE
jgi:phenylalanyl-tRNA synthetase alpha chain